MCLCTATSDRTAPTSSRTCVPRRTPALTTTGQRTRTSIRTQGSRGRASPVCSTTTAPTTISAGATTGWEARLSSVHAGRRSDSQITRASRATLGARYVYKGPGGAGVEKVGEVTQLGANSYTQSSPTPQRTRESCPPRPPSPPWPPTLESVLVHSSDHLRFCCRPPLPRTPLLRFLVPRGASVERSESLLSSPSFRIRSQRTVASLRRGSLMLFSTCSSMKVKAANAV